MRGWKAPNSRSGSTASGRLAWPVPKIGFEPEGVSIERLKIQDGRAVLTDAASGSRLVLDKLDFKGELRSLAGPIKGEGSFVVGRPALSLIASRPAHRRGRRRQGAARGRSDRPAADAPRPMSRSRSSAARRASKAPCNSRAGRSRAAGAQALIIEPWRVTSRDQGRQHGRRAGADRIPIRPGRPRDQAAGQRQPDLRRAAGDRRRAVVAADRSRPRARAARGDAPPPAGRHQDAGRILRRRAAAADPDDAEHRCRNRHARRRHACSASAPT